MGKKLDDIYIGGGQNKPNGRQNTGSSTDSDIYITPHRQNSIEDYDEYQNFEQPPKPPKRPEHNPQKKQVPKQKKKNGIFKKIVAVLLVLAVLAGVSVGMVYRTFSSINYNETGHSENVFLDSSDLMQNKLVQNILLIGVDRRSADDSSRSDTMLLVSIDSLHRKIKLTSFMRDSWVYIPEKKKNAKLNAACTYGGAQMVMDTIEYNFNIKIDHYLLVDFTMFEDIINGLGGVSVEITEKEAKYMRDIVHLTNVQAGEDVALNGKEALWYCRIRKLDSDFMRTQRQRKVMTSLIGKAKHTNIFSLYSLSTDIIGQIETDMSPAVLTRLAFSGAFSYLRYDVEQSSIPAEGTWKSKRISGQDVLSLDIDENCEHLKSFIYEE